MILRLCGLLLLVNSLFAEQLKITDSKGLTRLLTDITSSVNIEVQTVINLDSLKLVRSDEVIEDLIPKKIKDNFFLFENVTPGTWEIKNKTQIKSVNIINK